VGMVREREWHGKGERQGRENDARKGMIGDGEQQAREKGGQRSTIGIYPPTYQLDDGELVGAQRSPTNSALEVS